MGRRCVICGSGGIGGGSVVGIVNKMNGVWKDLEGGGGE